MKTKGWEKIVGVIVGTLLLGLILLLILPLGYVVRVLRETGSVRLLALGVAFLVLLALALLLKASLLLWVAILTLSVAVVVARVEQVRAHTPPSVKAFRPFDRYDR